MSEIRDKVVETRDNIADIGHLAKDAVRDKLHDYSDRVAARYTDGKAKLSALEADLAHRVTESPMTSVLLAAGAGLLLCILWRRR